MAKKSVKIQEIRELMAEYGATCIENAGIASLREVFEPLEDKRFEPYGEHLLPDIVMIALIGVRANADEWTRIAAFAAAKAEWLKSFLPSEEAKRIKDRVERDKQPRAAGTDTGDRADEGRNSGVEPAAQPGSL
jgi:hypothetical protein